MIDTKYNKSIIVLFRNIVLSIMILDIISLIILFIDYMNMRTDILWHKSFWTEEYFFILVLIYQIILIIYFFLRWVYSFYIIEKVKLIYYSWIIFKNKEEFIINQIWSISFKQSILWKIFNYWDIYLFIYNKNYKLSWISSPERFIKLIHYYNN